MITLNPSFAKALKAKYKVSRASLCRQTFPSPGVAVRVDLAFVASGDSPRWVAVSVDPMVPNPGNGYKILSDDEICAWLQEWGFSIDWETHVPQPDGTVNAANPIPMFGGLSNLMELLGQES